LFVEKKLKEARLQKKTNKLTIKTENADLAKMCASPEIKTSSSDTTSRVQKYDTPISSIF